MSMRTSESGGRAGCSGHLSFEELEQIALVVD